MDILITVDKQKMHCNNTRNFVAGSQDFVRFTFELSEEWDGLAVFAQFTQDGKSYNSYLDSSNGVYLPSEIGEGICYLALRGSIRNTIAVSECIKLNISKNPIVGNASSTSITLSLYEQLVNKVNNLLEDDGIIVDTTEAVLQRYLDDGMFAAMTISDNSINRSKLSDSAIATKDEIIAYLGTE